MIYYLNDFLLFNYLNKFIFSIIYFILEFKKKINKSFNKYIINFIDIEFDINKLETYLSKNKYNKIIKIILKTFFNNKIFYKSLKNLLNYFSFYIYIILLKYFFLRNL